MRTLFKNGQIYTGNTEELSHAQAFVVEDGCFLAVGNMEEVQEHVDNDTKVVDLGGKFVCAGFNDSHMHLLNYGYTLSMAKLSEHTSSMAEMLEYLRKFDLEEQSRQDQKTENADKRSETGEGEKSTQRWLMGRGWNQDYFTDEQRFPTRRDLDKVSTIRPICVIRACGHCCSVNSRALEVMGITGETPQPDGGYFELDAAGEPNGIFRENAVEYVYSRIPHPSLEQIKEMMQLAVRNLNAYGVTSAQTDDFETLPVPCEQVIRAYQELEQAGELTVRVYEQAQFTSPASLKEFLKSGWNTGIGSQRFRIGPLKIVADGSLGSRTAYLGSPYHDDPTTQGFMLYTPEHLETLIQEAAVHGMQTAVHAIGDGTLNVLLDIYQRVLKKYPLEDWRSGIVHCQITRPGQLERMAQLGLHAYIQSVFLDYDQRIVEERVGKETASSSYAFHTMKEKGIHVSNGSDCPVEAPDVLAGIQCAVTRKTLDGSRGPYRPEEAMSVREALDSYTSEGAHASFEEKVKGKIQKGMFADFVVLGENPFEVPGEKLGEIPVVATYVDGKCVYRCDA